MVKFSQATAKNILLSKMQSTDAELLAPHLEYVPLEHLKYLTHTDQIIESIYFPEDGIASVVSELPDIGLTEVGIFGRDGMSGTAVLLGSSWSPYETFMQVPGDGGWRLPTEKLLEAVGNSFTLQAFLLRYVQTQLVQSAHSAISNAHHRIDVRLARWILMCHDRLDGDDIAITHEFLSMMIAAQRSGVTLALHALEGEGFIRSTRGKVRVLDRESLQKFAGYAYGKPEAEYARLIGPLTRSQQISVADIGVRSIA